jgi:hypothetical protein
MKIENYKILLIILFAGLFLSSCKYFIDPEIEIVSELTTYPIFVLDGGELVTHQVGTPWSEPGFSCSEVEEGADDLTSSVIVDDSNLNVNERGLYDIHYTATNKYGYELTVTRSVLVTETSLPLFPIDGLYYQGFPPLYTIQFDIRDLEEVDAFWIVEGLPVFGKKLDIPMADLGDKTYLLRRTFLKLKIDLQKVYVRGEAVYDDSVTPNRIIFTIQQELEDGTPIGAELEVDYERE